MSGLLGNFGRHYLIRLREVCTQPFPLAVCLFTGLTSLVYWPGLFDLSKLDLSAGRSELLLTILWIVFLPMLAGGLVGGSIDQGDKEALCRRPMPALPVSMKTRALAESLVILTFALVARLPVLIFGPGILRSFYFPALLDPRALEPSAYWTRFALGGAILFPSMLFWTAPARSPQVYFLMRPLLLISAFAAAGAAGLIARPFPCLAVCTALSALFLLSLDKELPVTRFRGRSTFLTAHLHRPARDPCPQLFRDFLFKPLRPALGLLAFEALLYAGVRFFSWPSLLFIAGSCFAFGFAVSLVDRKSVV